MTQEQFYDLGRLGQKIQEYCRAMENLRTLKEGREMLAKGLRDKYPNMKIEAIRNTLWKQEDEFAQKVQAEFDTMRMYAYSLGWNFDYRNANDDVRGISRKPITNLNDINV